MSTPINTLLHALPLSHELQDAAAELACRIEHGEFDDLDEMQMADLKALSNMLAHWSCRAQALEICAADPAETVPALVQALPASIARN
jgi:CheY-specific phosphatase CheX